MKLVFVNRYFYPDISATSQILTDLAPALVEEGHEVHVICSRQLYEDPDAPLAGSEHWRGVHIHRAWASRFGRSGSLGRLVDYASFYLSAAVRLVALARRGDVLILKTDPPLLSVLGALVCRIRGCRAVNWLQDLFPEVAAELGVMRATGFPYRALQRARDWSLRTAACNVVLGHRMRAYLLERGVADRRIRVIANWADGEAIVPIEPAGSRTRASLALGDAFVVGYSGNLGRAHDHETLLGAAILLKDDPRIRFLLIGGGAGMNTLKAAVREQALANVHFLPYQPRSELADSLGAADVHLLSLLPALEALIVPSKFYGILAAGRPAVFVGDVEGELATALRQHDCGMAVACGNAAGLAAAIRALAADPVAWAASGQRARAAFDTHYTPRHALLQWRAELARIAFG